MDFDSLKRHGYDVRYTSDKPKVFSSFSRKKGGQRRFGYWAIKLSFAIICVFLLQIFFDSLGYPFTDLFLLNSSAWFQPWRFLTAVFLHGGIIHLIYNLFALFFFGSVLEKFVGSRKFLWLFFVSGVLANVFSVFFYEASLGASGAIFGVIGALVILRPGMMVFAFGMPMPMIVAGLIWAAGDIIGAVSFFSGNPIDNTGNLAHLSGMAFGILMSLYYKFKGLAFGKKEKKFDLDDNSFRSWEERYM